VFYPPMIGYVIIAVVCALLLIGINRGAIKRNRAIGIRTKHTLQSDEAWERGHRAAVPSLLTMVIIATGFAAVLLSVEVFDLPRSVGHVTAVSGWALILVCCLFAWRSADKAAKT
jgi:hypothetical protein